MSRYCGSRALVVGGEHRLPDDPCEYNSVYSAGPGCNNLRCESCGVRVRTGPVGACLEEGRTPKDLPAMYATADWTSLPFIKIEHRTWRLYACKCRCWEERSEHLLVNDHDSPSDPNMPWVCDGHPAPELPVTLGDFTISTDTDWATVVQRILGGACPRRLQDMDEGPSEWLMWLHAYLLGLPDAAKLSRAVGDRIDDPDDHVVGAVLAFFRRFPTADGIERVIARAESDLGAVFVDHRVPERDYESSLWDVMLSAMQQRTGANAARDVRVVKLVRKVMLLPAGAPDRLNDTLGNLSNANAFKEDDFAWMAENIVALEAAGPGRWSKIMNLLLHARRNNLELEHLILIGGIALIKSRSVNPTEIRAWIGQKGSRAHHAWVLPLEASLDQNP